MDLNETEPPLNKELVQYGYFLKNASPHLSETLLAQEMASKVIAIWKKVNPRLPLQDPNLVAVKLKVMCFTKEKEHSWGTMKAQQRRNWEGSMDKIFLHLLV